MNKRLRGFATMDKEKLREIASKGGKAAHLAGTAHKFTVEEAKKAGSKGGLITAQKRKENQINDKKDNGNQN